MVIIQMTNWFPNEIFLLNKYKMERISLFEYLELVWLNMEIDLSTKNYAVEDLVFQASYYMRESNSFGHTSLGRC